MSEQYSIFRAYLDFRHRDGGMADMTVLDYAMMVEDSHIETRIIEYRRREPGTKTLNAPPAISRRRLDRRARRRAFDGLSFFEPDEAARSLGTFMVLDHIARAQRMGCLTSISAIGSAARARWIIRPLLPQERLMPDGWARVE